MDHISSARISRMIRRVPGAQLRRVAAEVHREVRRRDMFFHFKKDVKRYLPMALKPWIITPLQRRTLWFLGIAIQRAAMRVYRLWFERRDLQALLPLSEAERRWFVDSYRGDFKRPETIMARSDLAGHLGRADWKERLRFLEVNLVGIGATYYSYSAGLIAHRTLAPLLPLRGLRPQDDLLEMIMGQCRLHGAKIGRRHPTVALLEYRRSNEGPFEYETMARIFGERGYRVVVADPIELEIRRGEIWHRETRVDILYRDPTLADLIAMAEAGDDLRAVKLAFRRNQVVSSLGGEMDHKGVFELFTSPTYATLFTPAERRMLRPYVPWTRVVREECAEEIRRRREDLVIKPNREYGGKGISIGMWMSAAEWDRVIEDGVRHPALYVAQQRVRFNTDDYPCVEDRRVRWAERYIVLGVHATARGMAILGRMSKEPVVNITRGGAVVGVLETGT